MNIEGKKVLLTGATGGIGRALATTLDADGAELILVARDKAKLQELQSQLTGPHTWISCDLNNPTSRANLIRSLNQQRISIDLLINNAGISEFSLFESKNSDRIEQLLQTNLIAPIQLTREVLPLLNFQGATILNIGSTLGSIGYPGYSTYCASKFGLRGFSESLSRELADTSTNVLYVAPRATNTAINTHAVNNLNHLLGNTVDQPDKVASMIMKQIKVNRKHQTIGWPEKLFVKLNTLFTGLISRVIQAQLFTIKQYAKESHHEVS